MSGAGASDTPSISTSRSPRSPIGKSAGAPSAAITASASRGSLAANTPKASPTVYVKSDRERSNSRCQVSLLDPGLFSRERERKTASTGFSREQPGAEAGAAVTTAGGLVGGALAVAGAGGSSNSWYSALSVRAVSLPPGTQRFKRSSLREKMASE